MKKLTQHFKKIILLVFFTVSLLVSKTYSAPRTGSPYYRYGEALQKAIFFYKIQRSGDLPDNYPVIWRADDCLDDGKDVGLDLTGGWHDCGDGVKVGNTIVYALSTLAWAVYEYREAFERSGLINDILDEIRWGAEYLIKCHPEPNVFYYYVGNSSDHDYWIPHEVLHLMTTRPSYKVDVSSPGSDVAGGAAAALALTSIVFKSSDPYFSQQCLRHAKELFNFAYTYQGISPSVAFYGSSSYLDDLGWAGVWLYLATNDSFYLEKAEECILSPNFSIGGFHTHCWDDVRYGAVLKLAQITGKSVYIEAVERNLDWWAGGGAPYSPGGLVTFDGWGNLRYVSAAAFLAFLWSDCNLGTASKKQNYRNFAESQINYILGDNPNNMSYIVGFGEKYPQHPHHRTAHCSWLSMIDVPSTHTHIAYGLLVGGPNNSDDYVDDVRRYEQTEGGIDYNAALVGALAKMYLMYGGEPLDDFPSEKYFTPKEQRRPEYFVRGWLEFQDQYSMDIIIQLNNRSAWPPTIKNKLSCRYFVDLSEIINAGISPESIQVSLLAAPEGVKITPLTQWYNNIYCITLDFTGIMIYPGRTDFCEKVARFKIRYNTTTWRNDNDWSYQNLTFTNDTTWDAKLFTGTTKFIPVYDDGILLWGEEPPRPNDTTSPQSPKNLQTIVLNSTQIKLTWEKPSDLDLAGYRIYRSTYPNFQISSATFLTELKVKEYVDKGLKSYTTYYYKVVAFDTSGNVSLPSNEAFTYTLSNVPAPTNLTGIALGPTEIKLSWQEVTHPDWYSYLIYRSTSLSANFILIKEVRTNEYIDSSLLPETVYYYYLTSKDKYGCESANSAIISVKTLQVDKEPPSAPTGVSFTPVDLTTILVDWKDNPEEDISHYLVYRSTTSGFIPSEENFVASVSTSSFLDTNLNKNTRYYYRIFAVDRSGNISEASEELYARVKFEFEIHARNPDLNTNDQWIKSYFRIVCNTGEEVSPFELKVRYYFTRDNHSLNELNPIKYTCQLENPYTGTLHNYTNLALYDYGPITGVDTCLEVTFSSGAPTFKGAGQYALMELVIAAETPFDETDDYSLVLSTSFIPWEKITLYRNGILVWGIEPGPPTANFNFSPLYPKVGQVVYFYDKSTDSNGEIVEWLWDFGDGTTSNQQSPTHIFTQPGNYTVTLSVKDNDGQTSSKSIAIKVTSEDDPPTCKIVAPKNQAIVYGLITISGTAVDDISVKSLELYLNEELLYSTTVYGTNYSFNYLLDTTNLSSSTYTVKLVVYDTKDQSAQDEITIIVDAPPACSISSPKDNENLFGVVTVGAVATDDNGISKFELYIDNEIHYSSQSVTLSTYTIILHKINTRELKLPDGIHEIKLVVYDTRNQKAEDKVAIVLENKKYAVVKKHIFISPNNDKVNEKIDFTSARDIKRILIYDTKGKILKELTQESEFVWEPKIGGKLIKTGMYIYKIEKKNGEVLVGSIVVVK